MTNITDIREMKARIVVFGVGGAGGNARPTLDRASMAYARLDPPPI
jgi:cell division GTPase FtsZ